MKFNIKQMAYRIVQATFIMVIAINNCLADNAILTTNQSTLLELHNTMRSWHHAPPLVWDSTLANYALRYAKQCEFKHSRGPYGENLAAGYRSVSDAVNAWYAEQKNYSYSRPHFSYNTGHFTQVVWRGTQKLGCGYVACNGIHGTPGNYLVCEYSPAGNISNQGYFANNVLPKT